MNTLKTTFLFRPRAVTIPGSGHNRSGMPAHSALSVSSNKVWLWCAVILAVLAIVTVTSIRTGPSADDAIVAIRLAQRDLDQAKRIHPGAKSPTLNDAEDQLILASSALKEKRYKEAILAARKVMELTRKLIE